MNDEEQGNLSADRAAEFFARKRRNVSDDDRTGWRASLASPDDGRLSSTVDTTGCVQLNIKVRVEIKALVLEERNKRKRGKTSRAGMGQIVEDALLAYLRQLK